MLMLLRTVFVLIRDVFFVFPLLLLLSHAALRWWPAVRASWPQAEQAALPAVAHPQPGSVCQLADLWPLGPQQRWNSGYLSPSVLFPPHSRVNAWAD